ncbi:putative F-box/FBD/LRR-repeat protein At5g22670 [Capsella rubella]|uniref:putative F-box/FBD/LRR-repeat protein At5g22670 n=1 Tax=Capsella rubella TaxID=81985 RepID=UPI000CD59FF9|nr:putative F-box/FBD/LRR-repeat protein At5g22670 [Capsella rubella]
MQKNVSYQTISIREDRISSLPDPILGQILLNLSTKDVVKTSLLSTRWRSVWRSVPGLDLADYELSDYSSFVNFVNSFVEFSVVSPIVKLKLTSKRERSDPLAINSWVDEAVTRKLQHLEIRRCNGFELLPISLFVCKTLTMHLEGVRFTNHAAIETLIASCPVLEDLSIVQNDLKAIRVFSDTISSINLVRDVSFTNHQDVEKCEVEIYSPRLKYLSLKDNKSSSFTIYNLCPSAKVDIAVDFNVKGVLDPNDSGKRSFIRNFLNMISSVHDMIICWKTLKELNGCTKKKKQISISYVPWCLFSSLESVEMKTPIRGTRVEMELIKYFLENSRFLKKLFLRVAGGTMKEEYIIFMEILRFRRCSSACRVNVVGLEETMLKL